MSGADPNPRLLEVALSVADRDDVDWAGALAESPDLEDTLAALRDVARVAGEYGESAESAAEAATETLFAWGPLRARRRIGHGSFGEVFAAWDPALQREVALKLRRTDAGGRGSLAWLEEARRLARVRHPNVVTVYGADVHDERAGMWTELLAGRTLEESLATQGPLGAREAALVGLDLCAALAAVHATGLVHGDVKASNVMRVGAASGDVGASGRIVLMDFGAAHDGAAGATLGTPLSAAPEVLRGESATPASDLYALGVLLFRLVTGRHPVEARTLDQLRAHHERGERLRLRDVRPGLSREFVDAVERALDPDPSRRFASAAEMERALSPIVAPALASASAPTQTTPSPSTQSSATPGRVPALAWAALAIVLVGGAWFALSRRPADVSSNAQGPAAETSRGTPTASGDGASTPIPASPGAGGANAASEATAPTGAAATSGAASVGAASGLASVAALDVDAVLYRVTDRGREALRSGDRIGPGDRLALEIGSPEAIHAYVLDEDDGGHVFVLFPLDRAAGAGRLSAGTRHRLPGAKAGETLDWQVTSAGGRETFLIVAGRAPIDEVERAVAGFQQASEGNSVGESGGSANDAVHLRSVGGVVRSTIPAARGTSGRLQELARRLDAAPSRDRWVRTIVLENPGR